MTTLQHLQLCCCLQDLYGPSLPACRTCHRPHVAAVLEHTSEEDNDDTDSDDTSSGSDQEEDEDSDSVPDLLKDSDYELESSTTEEDAEDEDDAMEVSHHTPPHLAT